MGDCWHHHGCGCWGYGPGWDPGYDYGPPRRRGWSREGQLRDLEARQAELEEALGEIAEAIRRLKEEKEAS